MCLKVFSEDVYCAPIYIKLWKPYIYLSGPQNLFENSEKDLVYFLLYKSN